MKKFLALALSLLMILSLAACGNKGTDAEQNDGPSSGKDTYLSLGTGGVTGTY